MEVLGYQFRDHREEVFINEMLGIFSILYIDQGIADATIDIRRRTRIKLPDAIIAATAKVSDLQLVTRNTADFQNAEIQVINPFG